MQWLNEPASWQRTGDVLRVSVDPGTDFWRTTGYGYVHDNGHVYGDLLPGDLDVSVRVRGAFANQYDQAGIMLRADEETWLKTGLEFFEGRPRLSTVLTVGWSSWMVADLPPGTDEVTMRVSRRGDAVEVRYAAGDGAAELAALVFLPPDREMLAGIVCAAPEGTGFSVAFHDLRIVGREWAGQGAADGAGWASESPAPAVGWAEEQAAGAGASWAGDVEGRGGERADDGTAGWAGDEPGGAASGRAGDKAEDGPPGWAGDKPGQAASGRAGDTPVGVPAGWGDAPPGKGSFDWAKPLASEPADDWDRLSLSVSTSWNAFAAAAPTEEDQAEEEPTKSAGEEQEPEEPAKGEQEPTATDQASQDSKDSTGALPESPSDEETEPVPPAVSPPPAAAEPGDPQARGRDGRRRNKAKPSAPRPPALPAPADPADEWISLLTADSAEELSGPGANRTRREPGRWEPGRSGPDPA
jgi:regulation of enolase protein 1 (concanavalin A-like superfamily)